MALRQDNDEMVARSLERLQELVDDMNTLDAEIGFSDDDRDAARWDSILTDITRSITLIVTVLKPLAEDLSYLVERCVSGASKCGLTVEACLAEHGYPASLNPVEPPEGWEPEDWVA